MPKLHWEDFKPGAVAVYGPRLVTREEIVAFAAEFDPQPMHLDEAAASATLLGGLGASGWHTCCLLMRMIADGFMLNSSSMGAPGIDEVRWLKPLRPGTQIRVRATVLDKRASNSRPEMGLVKFRYEVLDEAGRVPDHHGHDRDVRPPRSRGRGREIFRGHPRRRRLRSRPLHLHRRQHQGLRRALRSAAVPCRRGSGGALAFRRAVSPPAGTPRWPGCG